MATLKERLAGYRYIKPLFVSRSGLSYHQTEVFTKRCLKMCIWTYSRLQSLDQTASLIRDIMVYLLREYHNYCIRENIGAHYREVGLPTKTKTEFEHVIPVAIVRDMLIHGKITVDEALNVPTCTLSKKNHTKLSKNKLGSNTPDIVNFWKRYQQVLNIEIETHDGTKVDLNTWDLEKHFNYFNIK